MIALPLISGEETNVLTDEDIDLEYQTNEYKGRRVLYVEDICENQMVMKQLFIQLGFSVEIASDGAEGLHLFQSKQSHYYDLILTDLRMPNMSGQTMIMQIRHAEQLYIYIYIYISLGGVNTDLIPIIVLTGDPSENEKNKCLNILKANAFLTKPISMLEFNRELRKIFVKEEVKEGEGIEVKDKKLILVVDDNKLLNNLIKLFLADDYEVIQAYSVAEVNIFLYTNIFNRVYQNSKRAVKELVEFVWMVSWGMAQAEIFSKLFEIMKVHYIYIYIYKLEKVLHLKKEKYTKVVSISGNPIEDQRETYRSLHVDEFLYKPFSKNRLLAALQVIF